VLTHLSQLLKRLSLLLILGTLSLTHGACLPSTIDPSLLNGIPSSEDITDTDTPEDETDSETESVAQDQCTLYDKSNPLRDFCVGCYDELVSTYCPGKTSINDCVDAEFILDFPTRLNQCIDATVVAGFTCSKTCSSTQVLDEVSCSCVSASTTSGSTALEQMDRGQYDIGPPVVTASFGQTIERIVFDGDTGETADSGLISDCALGSSDSDTNPLLFLAIRNRTGTRVQDNVMTATKSSTAVTGINFSVSAPEVLATSGAIGANGGAAVSLSDQGTDMFEDDSVGSYSGVIGGLRRLSGIPEPGPSPTPTATPAANDLAQESAWNFPGYTARDEDGNIYVSDTAAGKIYVICYQASDWCSSTSVGEVVHLAGGGTDDTYMTKNGIDPEDALFSSPMGITVDQHKNIYIADHGNQTIAILCLTITEGVCSRGGAAVKKLYGLAGALVSGGPFDGGGDLDSGTTRPIALDIETNESSINLFIGGSNGTLNFATGSITKICEFSSLIGSPCSAATNSDNISSDTAVTDVKLNAYGNLFWVEPNLGRIRADCYTKTKGDACHDRTLGILTLNSATVTTESGDGGALSSAGFVLPFRLVIAKRFADDYTNVDEATNGDAYNFADKNLIVISALSTFNNTAGRAAGGNTVRIVCGTTVDGNGAGSADDFAGSKGFCEDLEEGKVYTLAGQSGRSVVGAFSTPSPRSVSFGNLTGGTYDRFKNLILTSAHDTTLFENDDDLTDQDGDGKTDDVDNDIDGDELKNAVRANSLNPFVDTDGDGEDNCRDDDHDNDGEIDHDIDDDNNGLKDCEETGRFDETKKGLSGDDPDFPPVYDNSVYSLQLVHKSSNLRVRYNFTDSNNFTSRYCLEMRMQSTCGFALEDAADSAQKVFCACNVTGPSGGTSVTDFWRGVPRDEDCQ